jgi:hypothetical protein
VNPDGGTAPSRWVWASLSADEAADLWGELVDWVEWVRERFELGQKIPACWFNHPPVVEELTALMAGWRAVYEVPRAEDGAVEAWAWARQEMTAFMTHEFRPTVGRLRDVSDFEGCDQFECGHVPSVVVTLPDLGEVIARDIDARH